MRLISHRGNINGRFESYENEPNYIDSAIDKGYDVEVDVWYKDGILYLGHDEPQYGVTMDFFRKRITRLWIHCKNIEALMYFKNHKEVGQYTHYFWHQGDDVTLTSFNFLWTYPGKPLFGDSICVMPETVDQVIPDNIHGICSDYIEKYKK